MPMLEIDSLSRSFGGVQAVDSVTFSLEQGSITGLIGPNGAGKTTLFNLITGVLPADSGSIVFEGRKIGREKSHELVCRGITRTFQNVELFSSMTVLENVLVGQHTQTRCGMWDSVFRSPRFVREEREARKTALDLLEFVGLAGSAHQRSSYLAFGLQRLIELARALASRPKLLLLDEPAAGLNTVETSRLGELIEKVREKGVTILLVEHDMSLTMTVSDHIVVLDQGRKIAEGTPREVQDDEAVIKAYLGTDQPKTGESQQEYASHQKP